MKLNVIKMSFFAALVGGLLISSSCHRDPSDNNTNCPGTVIATWKVDGVDYKTPVAVSVETSNLFVLTLTACVNDANDKSITFGEVPYPAAQGNYPIKFKMLHAQIWNGTIGADYLTDNDGNYFTDTVAATGLFTVNSVDTVNKKFSGGFNFDATNDAATKTVHITSGVLINAPY